MRFSVVSIRMPDYFDNRVTISVSVYGSVRASVILMVICYAAPCSRFGGQLIKASVGRENFPGAEVRLQAPTSNELCKKSHLNYRGVRRLFFEFYASTITSAAISSALVISARLMLGALPSFACSGRYGTWTKPQRVAGNFCALSCRAQ